MTVAAKIFIIYITVMTVAGFLSMYIDKRRARKHRWRISEKALFLTALLGGSIGSNLGMMICRHKTKHWYFVVGMPAIFIVQMVLVTFLQFRFSLFF